MSRLNYWDSRERGTDPHSADAVHLETATIADAIRF